MSVAPCHPDRRHYARGMCEPCYNRARNLTRYAHHRGPYRSHADCHPLRPHHANGLCSSCYGRGRGSQRRHLLAAYGLTLETFAVLEAAQGGRCAICGDRPTTGHLRVDHDHETGAVRGLLCNRCNRALGLFGDDADLVAAAAGYLAASAAALRLIA